MEEEACGSVCWFEDAVDCFNETETKAGLLCEKVFVVSTAPNAFESSSLEISLLKYSGSSEELSLSSGIVAFCGNELAIEDFVDIVDIVDIEDFVDFVDVVDIVDIVDVEDFVDVVDVVGRSLCGLTTP